MASVRRTVTLPPAAIVCEFVLASVAATPRITVGESLATTPPMTPPPPSRPRSPLTAPPNGQIQRRLRNEGFDPGTPDGRFRPGPRRDSRLAAVPRTLTDEVPARRATELANDGGTATGGAATGGAALAALPGAATAPSAAATTASMPRADSNSPTTSVDPKNAAATNTQQRPRAGPGDATVQLPPKILVDRHLVRAERLPHASDPAAAFEAVNEVLALHAKHGLVLQEVFGFACMQVAHASRPTQTTVPSANQYIVAAGREGGFYRKALNPQQAFDGTTAETPLEDSMRLCLLATIFLSVITISLVAQESLWSGTMTAGRSEINGDRLVGYNRNPQWPMMGELGDATFDLRGTTYRVYSLLQTENNPLLGEGAVVLAFSPLVDHQDLDTMTLTVGGTLLQINDAGAVVDEASDDPPWTSLYWADPGFRWTDGQRIDAELTMAQPVPALPHIATGFLAFLVALGGRALLRATGCDPHRRSS